MDKLDLEFYYGQEAEQFTFYRLPKALIIDPRFKDVSNNAKLLYGLMLDRMSLSVRSGWFDEENRVYIKYGIKSIMEDLRLGKDSAQRLLKELEKIGLIEVEKRTGVSNIIYVKNFISGDREAGSVDQAKKTPSQDKEAGENIDQAEKSPSRKMEVGENVDQAEKSPSCENEVDENIDQAKNTPSLEMEPGEIIDQSEKSAGSRRNLSVVPGEKVALNNNKSNNTDFNDNNLINPSQEDDGMDEATAYMELIRENIDYDIMMQSNNWPDREMYEELYEIICDVVCVPRKVIRIAGEEYPYALVKSKFLKLKSSHLQYVIGCVRKNTTKVNNIKAYLITALYNAPSTMGHYYTAEVNHDIFNFG